MVSPFCRSSVSLILGLPPPPARAFSTAIDGTNFNWEIGGAFSRGVKNAAPNVMSSNKKPWKTAEANKHFFSNRLIRSARYRGRVGAERNLVETGFVQSIEEQGHMLVKSVLVASDINQQLRV